MATTDHRHERYFREGDRFFFALDFELTPGLPACAGGTVWQAVMELKNTNERSPPLELMVGRHDGINAIYLVWNNEAHNEAHNEAYDEVDKQNLGVAVPAGVRSCSMLRSPPRRAPRRCRRR